MDLFHLPIPGNKIVEVFRPADTTGTTPGWQSYTRPRGATFCAMWCGSGGGGGAGALGAAASTGAGGGGSSGLSRALFMWDSLPERLYLRVGRGGLAVATNTAGNAGQLSHITVHPDITSNANIILVSGAAAPAGGAIAGTGGAGGTVATVATCLLSGHSLAHLFTAGTIGAAGGVSTGAVGGSVTIVAAPFLSGAGGGGVTTADFAGGGMTGQGIWPTLVGGTAGGGRGQDGYAPRIAFGGNQFGLSPMYYGGTGGGTLDLGTGGAGGNGAIGCGGGGGGGGTTGGGGGAGGTGIIVIASW